MRSLLSAGLMAATLLTAPAIAADKKAVDPDKKVCRRDYNSTGTILPKSVCHTNADWKAIDEASRAQADAMRLQRSALPGR